MSAFSTLIPVTVVSPASTLYLGTAQIVKVITSGSGAAVYYYDNGGALERVVVSETPAQIYTAAQTLIALTLTGGTVYINANLIISVITDGATGSYVMYNNPEAATQEIYEASESPSAIRTAVAAIVSSGGGSVTTGLTAFAGGGQASATQLSFGYNEVTTVATAGDSVKLQPAQAGAMITVLNDGANAMDVFPATGDTINDGAANTAISVAPGVTLSFTAINSTNWETSSQVVETDSMKEFTSGAGITVQSKMIFQAPNIQSLTTGITAFATGGQASATALTKLYNNITTCATAGDSVKLLAAVAGLVQVVKNNGATAADVFPNTGDTINGGAANTAIRLAVGETIVFTAIDATDWQADYAGAGTVGNPSLPVGTKNKGFYQVSANQLGVSVNGALSSMFDTDGFLSDSVRNRVNLGTTPVGTVAIVEHADGKDVTTVLTLTNFIVGALAGAAANLGVGNIVYSFPAGQHFELVYSLSDIVLTAAGTPVATDTGLGSVIATGAVAVLSGTATFEDRLTGQTITTDPVGGAAASALTAATAGIGTGISLNLAAGVKDVFLNSAGAWNVDNVGDLTASGTIVLKWTRMM